MYDHLLFDADGTLFDFEAAERWALTNLFTELGIDGADTAIGIYSGINNKLWEEFESGLITLEDLKTERFNRLFQRYGLPGDPSKAALRYIDHLSASDHLFPETIPLLDELIGRGYGISLITNGISRVQRGRLAATGIGRYFRAIVISEEIGVQKPHPAYFSIALGKVRETGVPADFPLIVGDSLTSDIRGGIDAGIDTCWFNPRHIGRDPAVVPTYEIDRLEDLPLLLASEPAHGGAGDVRVTHP